jgi:indole-3-glycerol phosphate synthase
LARPAWFGSDFVGTVNCKLITAIPTSVPDILARIVARKRQELAESRIPRDELDERARIRIPRDFAAALRASRPAVIAEIKKASPSRGVLAPDFNPVAMAKMYEAGGAAALSVLTDRDFFQGGFEHLQAARAAVALPVIRKDFTIDEYHVREAAAFHADAILLIAAILDHEQMRGFRELAESLGLAALVEVHNESELDAALKSGASIVGVNNRDLRTFEVHLETSLRLSAGIPAGILRVSESGIGDQGDVRALLAAGFDAFLVGEHLMKAPDPALALRSLLCS